MEMWKYLNVEASPWRASKIIFPENFKKRIKMFFELEKFKSGIDLFGSSYEGILKESIKKKFEGDIHKQFSLTRDHSYKKNIFDEENNRIYGDTKYKFILKRNGLFAATIGLEPSYNSVVVVQIQGVPGGKEMLKEIKWPNALLNISTEWGRVNGLEKIFVLPHQRSKWMGVSREESPAKMYYDITAKRLGFKLNENGLYEKVINF